MNDGSIDVDDLPSDLSESEEEEEEEEEEVALDDEEAESNRNRKRALRAAREAKREEHNRKRRKLASYEEYNFYSRPVSFQVRLCELFFILFFMNYEL